jgi:hypothetical protein
VHYWLEDLFSDVLSLADFIDALAEAVDTLRPMHQAGVVMEAEESGLARGQLLLVAPGMSVAKQFGFQPEEKPATEEDESK